MGPDEIEHRIQRSRRDQTQRVPKNPFVDLDRLDRERLARRARRALAHDAVVPVAEHLLVDNVLRVDVLVARDLLHRALDRAAIGHLDGLALGGSIVGHAARVLLHRV